MAAYFMGASRGLPGGATVFFGEFTPHWFGWTMWIGSSALLAVPFAAFWSRGKFKAIGFSLALIMLSIPPFGIFAWTNPLAVSGVIYPGAGWFGIFLALGACCALAARSLTIIAFFFSISVCAQLSTTAAGPGPSKWMSENTGFAKLAGSGEDDALQVMSSMNRIDWVIDRAKQVPPNSVLLLPETLLGQYGGLAEYKLAETEEDLARRNSRVIVGAELALPDGKYKNVIVNLGANSDETKIHWQRIPVPISMWRPWATDGAYGNIFHPANVSTIQNRKVGIAICYEQLLAYSLLSTLSQHPDVLLSPSNVWWARGTSIPNIQYQTSEAFGRLFGVSILHSTNI
jgi:hypothetical protein